MEREKESGRGRVCDFCSEGIAILYCRADSAKLCLACDREVHSTNQLFTKHTRCLLCDVCGSSPVSIFCCTEKSVLCQNCDWEAHKPGPSSSSSSSSGLHDRRPLDGFNGCPSVAEFLAILGFDDMDKKTLFLFGDNGGGGMDCGGCNSNCNGSGEGDFGFLDLSTWDCSSIVSVDELKASNDSICAHNFQAIGIPPLPKNRNAVCGQRKEEILHQLREMSKLEPNSDDCDGCLDSSLIEFQTLVPQQNSQLRDKDGGIESNVEPTLVPSHEGNAFPWCTNASEVADKGFTFTLGGSYADTNHLVPEKDSDLGDAQSHNPIITENFDIVPKVVVREINSQERDSAISRYKEKKKTRRYEKHIRYESRKVRAESRTRIKGRFAKMGPRQPGTQ